MSSEFAYRLRPRKFLFPLQAIPILSGFACLFFFSGAPLSYAQVSSPPITSSGLNTQVGAPINVPGGKVQHDITGGTRPGSGTNLFHSFGEFGVPANNIANFLNESGRATSNILGRVTGGNPSNIFGMIKTTDFGNANLFLMNPAGILFGPNAQLDVGGSVHFTTADYLRLTDGARFSAVPGSQDALLSAAPVAAFGFLSPTPAPITFQGSRLPWDPLDSPVDPITGDPLSIPVGRSITVVAGNITIAPDPVTGTPSTLLAPGGQINLASVASPGEILYPTLAKGPNIDGQTFSSMGAINVSGNAKIDVSSDAAGTVIIRGGQLMILDSTISADTGDLPGAPTAIDIHVTGPMSIANDTVPALTAQTSGSGHAGAIQIESGSVTATFTAAGSLKALIDSHSAGTGKSGSITLTTGDLTVIGDPSGYFIDSGTAGEGDGGNVTIKAGNVHFLSAAINTGDFIYAGLGSGGNLKINADSLNLELTSLVTNSENARGGDLTLEAREITLTGNSSIGVLTLMGGSTFTIDAERFAMDGGSTILNQTAIGPGGGITITAKSVELTNGSQIASQTAGDGHAGSIRIVATDHVILSDDTLSANPSGLFTNSSGNANLGTLGNSGGIEIETPVLTMVGGARINSTTQSNGRGGDVAITTTLVSISGERPFEVPSETFGVGGTRASGVYTRTIDVGFCNGPCGDAGNVIMKTGSLSLGAGAVIDSGTSSAGRGGDISVNATGTLAMSGRLSDGTPSGIFSRTVDPATGAGGKIDLRANQISLGSGASVSAESTGTGAAGSISIQAVDSFISQNGSITTSTTQSDGGNIAIIAGNLVHLVDSQITTNVQGGAGNGGNISIDPPTVLIDHSKVIASAIGGNGGNINIVAGIFLVSPDSLIDASSTFGLSGTINIESPITNLSGTLAPLPQGFLQPAAFPGRCAARMQGGQSSTLVVRTSRDRIPAEPGDLLLSPLFASTQGPSVARRSQDLDALRAGLTEFPVPGGCPS